MIFSNTKDSSINGRLLKHQIYKSIWVDFSLVGHFSKHFSKRLKNYEEFITTSLRPCSTPCDDSILWLKRPAALPSTEKSEWSSSLEGTAAGGCTTADRGTAGSTLGLERGTCKKSAI
jgi:hypothetical protein